MPEARVQEKADPARAEVRIPVVGLAADIRQQSGQQRLVDRRVARVVDLLRQRVGPLPAQLAHLLAELVMQVAPFAQPQVRHEMRAAAIDQRAVRQLRRQRVAEELPEREQAQEIGALVAKAQVRLVGGLLLVQRPIARIGHRERAGDDQHLGETAAVLRGENHAADARIDRQPRELAAERRERRCVVHRTQLLQQLIAVGDRARARRLDERKRVDGARDRARPCAGSPPRARCAGSRARCTRGRAAKSSSPYRRTHTPAATRPQRPARWLADAREIFSICSSVTLLRSE